jgi:hypothetical protein
MIQPFERILLDFRRFFARERRFVFERVGPFNRRRGLVAPDAL